MIADAGGADGWNRRGDLGFGEIRGINKIYTSNKVERASSRCAR